MNWNVAEGFGVDWFKRKESFCVGVNGLAVECELPGVWMEVGLILVMETLRSVWACEPTVGKDGARDGARNEDGGNRPGR